MIRLNARQMKVFEIIRANPGIKFGRLKELSEMSHGHISGVMSDLNRLGLLIKDGKPKGFEYRVKDIPVKIRGETDVEETIKVPDSLLESLMTFTFTTKQLEIVRANKHLTRRELAKLLGIPKLELNIAMERMGKA